MSTQAFFMLHVDDDSNDLLLLEHASRAAGMDYLIQSCNDGETAIAYLSGNGVYADRKLHPLPTLVLLDLKMPRQSGFEVLAWIRNHPYFKKLMVIVFTSSRHQEDVDRAYALGANAYLVKPVGFDRLVEVIKILDAWLKLNEKPTIPPLFSYCPPPAVHGMLPA